MIEESEARKRILELTPTGSVVTRPLIDALGSYLAENISAKVDLPGFDNSEMDGYAVRAEEASVAGAQLQVTGEQAAGVDMKLSLGEGEALRIFTGAPIPQGADAVIMQEDVKVVSEEGASSRRIEIVEAVDAKGEFIRRRGSDVCIGQKIVSVGEEVTPGRIGLLASQGISEVKVYQVPRVAVVTTGNELIESGTEMKAGQIFNSNAPMLAALVKSMVSCKASLFHAPDDPAVLKVTLETALDENEVILIAGGISVGEHDLVKMTLNDLGVETEFWRVRVKPGKPFLFGRRGKSLVFGLPGNPVAAYTTFLLFVASALRKWEGAADIEGDTLPLLKVRCRLGEKIDYRMGRRPHYMRGFLKEGDRIFVPVGLQASHAIYGLSRADALLRVDSETILEAGAEVEVLRLP